MSFNYFGMGAYLDCECKNSTIYVYRNCGDIEQYPIYADIVIHKQNTPFKGKDVLFYLEEDGTFLVGRSDGSVGQYRLSDNLLLGVYSWKPPKNLLYQEIGTFTRNKRLYQMYLNVEDKRTCYILGLDNEYVFNEPFNKNVNLSTALAYAMRNGDGVHIVTENLEEVNWNDEGRWFIPNTTWCGNPRELL